ncbi:hypothetical protein DL766_010486 [Monosporascus sp. MC13-8B]|uniref:Uncharacterized protein n=1 Tax=Monosporascus cannonballus TaxID=155416 RepID=A0ABY0HIU9_9PEZI|nr:hypothetical protein DL763_005530 [Monosporascus cannonballus]RYO91595.1 hypothetical protein DL762_002128 [Monosporascus cannonballus]RYP02228.1 hypothetical protein DL766_010486 [Monosporascus sp. MC13-8B]
MPPQKNETSLLKRISSNRISKAPATTSKPKKAIRRCQQVRTRQVDNPEQFDCAVRIFTGLPAIPGLAGQAPRLRGQNRNRLEIELQYPDYGLWRVVDRVHPCGDRTTTLLRVQDIRQLRDAFLNDLSILCASQIACNTDISTLRIAHRRRPSSAFVPFLDIFDLNMCVEQGGNKIHWVKHKRDMVQKVKTQFEVLELLAQLSSPRESWQQNRYNNTDLDAEAVAHVLEAAKPPSNIGNLVIRHVKRYSPELARFAAGNAQLHLYTLGKRTSPPDRSSQGRTVDYCNTVRHVLQLGSGNGHIQQYVRLLADRAALLVIYATLLVQLYGNVIVEHDSQGVLRLDCPGDSPDAYTTYKSFQSVAQARYEAKKAIQDLYAAGGKLDDDTCWFLSDKPVAA